MARLLSSLPVGAKVVDPNTKYNGKPITWLVGGHDHYAQGQSVLVSEKIITLKAFDAIEASSTDSNRRAAGNSRYSVSNIRQWLNSDKTSWYSPQHSADAPPSNENVWSGYNDYDTEAGFLTNFSLNMKDALITTSLTTAKNTATDGGGIGSSEIVSDKVFLLSTTEFGLSNSTGVSEGKSLPLFNSDASRMAYPTAEAVSKSEYKNSTSLVASNSWGYWVRSPNGTFSHSVELVHASGARGSYGAYGGDNGVRPALNLSSVIVLSDDVNSNGEYEIIWPYLTPSDRTDLGSVTDNTSILKYTPTAYPAGTTVTEKINGIVVGTKTIINDTEYTVSATVTQWNAVKYGKYKDTLGNKNVVTLEVSTGEIYTYPFTKTLPTTAKTNDVLVAVNDMSNTAMPSHKKKLVDAIGNKATIGGTGTLEDIAKAIESISVESMGGMKTAKGTFTTSMDNKPKVSVRGLAFKPKGILYKTPTGTPCGVYFIKEFYDGNLFRGDMTFDRISSGATSFGTSYFTPVDGGFDAMVGSYTERGTIYDYIVFG